MWRSRAKALRLCHHRPGERRQRTLPPVARSAQRRRCRGPSRPLLTAATSALTTTASASMRSPLASFTPAARPPSTSHLARFGRVAERRAAGLARSASARRCRACRLDEPNALPLDMGDQHQRRGREERRRAAIGGVAAEQLAQTRIAEVVAERAPHARERAICQRSPRPRNRRPRPESRAAAFASG